MPTTQPLLASEGLPWPPQGSTGLLSAAVGWAALPRTVCRTPLRLGAAASVPCTASAHVSVASRGNPGVVLRRTSNFWSKVRASRSSCPCARSSTGVSGRPYVPRGQLCKSGALWPLHRIRDFAFSSRCLPKSEFLALPELHCRAPSSPAPSALHSGNPGLGGQLTAQPWAC